MVNKNIAFLCVDTLCFGTCWNNKSSWVYAPEPVREKIVR